MSEKNYSDWSAKIDSTKVDPLSADEQEALRKLMFEPVYIRACAIAADGVEKEGTKLLGFDLRDPTQLQKAIDAQNQTKALLRAIDFCWTLIEAEPNKEPGK